MRPNPAQEKTIPGNAQRQYRVTATDLTLSCPMPGMSLWNSHPRVFLPIAADGGHTRCPYCSAEYTLADYRASTLPLTEWA